MRPSSRDLRERVAAAVDPHEGSPRPIARTFRVRLSFVVRLLQRRRDAGTWEPQPQGGSPPPALGSDDRQRLDGLLAERPDATLVQLKQRGGFRCRLTTLWRALRRQRLTPKKKSLSASQRGRPEVPKKRRACRRKVSRIEPKRRIFGDEPGVTTAMTPASARAPRGAWAVASAPTPWATRTVITALGRDGVCAPPAFPGSADTVVFGPPIGTRGCGDLGQPQAASSPRAAACG